MEKPKIYRRISKFNHTSYRNRNIKYIVIHWVGAVSTAKNNADYFAGGNRRASAHYFVDDNEIWQSIENKNAAWHCGGGLQGSGGHAFYNKCTNANSIGIEMCCKKKDGKMYVSASTIKRTAELVQHLMDKHNIPASRVIRHFDVTGKDCPAPFTSDKKWAPVKEVLTGKKAKAHAYPTVTIQKGDTGEQVKRLQRCLNKIMKSGLAVDGSFGPATTKYVKSFQRKYGLAVDGSVGPKTREKIKNLL